MISEAVIQSLKKYVPEENICLQEPMAGHTTFRIGGPADCLLELEGVEQLIGVQGYLSRVGVPFFLLGNGSNLLVSDEGYRGVVLRIGQKMSGIEVEGSLLKVQAGATMAQAARAALEHGLTGLEFASGIPGTVGGGVVMNAGAYGGEIKDCLVSATVLDADGAMQELEKDELELGYRTSVIQKKGYIVLEALFQMKEGDRRAIQQRMREMNESRRQKQPLEYPSAGSTFKRPEGHFAGKLIEDAGLRGYRVGDAQVSEKHCGFVINRGNATAAQVRELIAHVQEKVFQMSGIKLEPEVKII